MAKSKDWLIDSINRGIEANKKQGTYNYVSKKPAYKSGINPLSQSQETKVSYDENGKMKISLVPGGAAAVRDLARQQLGMKSSTINGEETRYDYQNAVYKLGYNNVVNAVDSLVNREHMKDTAIEREIWQQMNGATGMGTPRFDDPDDYTPVISYLDTQIDSYKKTGARSNPLITAIQQASERAYGNGGAKSIKYRSDILTTLEQQRTALGQKQDNLYAQKVLNEIKNNKDEDLFARLQNIDTVINSTNLYKWSDQYKTMESGVEARKAERENIIKALKEKGYSDPELYLKYYSKIMNNKAAKDLNEDIDKFVKDHSVVGPAAATAYAVATAGASGITKLAGKAFGDTGFNALNLVGAAGSAMTESVTRNIQANNPGTKGKVFSFLYNAGVSALESASIMGTLGGGIGEAIMGLNAAMDTYDEARAKGVDGVNAFASAFAAGVFEAVFEHVGWDKISFLASSGKGGRAAIIKDVLVSMGTEGAEEVLTDMANELADYLINGGLSEYELAKASGMSDGEYAKQLGMQLLESFAAGAVSGGMMYGSARAGNAIGNKVTGAVSNAVAGSDVQRTGSTQDLISEATLYPQEEIQLDSLHLRQQQAKTAEAKNKVSQKISEIRETYKAGKLYNAIDDQNVRSAVSSRIDTVNSGLDEQTRKNIADGIAEAMKGKTLTEAQAAAINTETGRQILDEVINNDPWVQEMNVGRLKTQATAGLTEARAERAMNMPVGTLNARRQYDDALKEKTGEITKAIKADDGVSLVNNMGELGGIKAVSDTGIEVVIDKNSGATSAYSDVKSSDADVDMIYDTADMELHGTVPADTLKAFGATVQLNSGAKMSLAAANVQIGMYDKAVNSDAAAYMTLTYEAYKAGLSGMTFETYMNHHSSAELEDTVTEGQLRQMYRMGASDHIVKPGVTRIGTKALSQTELDTLTVLDTFFKDKGRSVFVVDEMSEDNAYYVAGKDTIVLALNAEGGLLTTAAFHELLHQTVNELGKEEGDKLVDAIIDVLRMSVGEEKLDEIYSEKKRQYEDIIADMPYSEQFEYIKEEIAAQYFGSIASVNEDYLANHMQKDMSFWQKIMDKFRKILDDIREKAKAFADRDLIVASALKTEDDKAQKVLEAFEKAFEKAKASAEKKENAGEHSGIRYSQKFESYTPNSEVLSLISKVKSDSFHQNEKVLLSSNLSVKLINEIKKITGIDVTGFKVAIEARQINHILKKHGVNGDEDNSMSNDNDIAKLEYVLDDPDYISYGGKTNAYSFAKNGHNHTSNTVLYEKEIGDKSFYVVEAVADTKAKTLYIVTSFIGKKGYKKGTSQLINAQSPNATSEADSVVVPNNSIQKGTEKSNSKNKKVNNSPTAEAKHSRRSSTIYDELIEKRAELRDLQQKMKDMKESDEYQEILNESTRAENIDAFVKKYSDYLKSSGMDKLSKDIEDLNKEVERLSEEFSAASNAEGEEKERADIEKSGKTEGDYFTSLAVKEFGYTPYYYDAGYMTQNGKLLNFSGEKGKHYGSRGQDHRAIGTIFENETGGEALLRFMSYGNIRIMDETPGVDIHNSAEPTAEQYKALKRYVNECLGREYFSVDFTDSNGYSAGALEYENRFSADRVINDIKKYFETGELREQSVVEKFRYSKKITAAQDAEYMQAVKNGDMDTAQRMVSEAARAAGYQYEAWHGTKSSFNAFDKNKLGNSTHTLISKKWFFAADKNTASSYYPFGVLTDLYETTGNESWNPNSLKPENRGNLYHLFIKMNNPLIVDVSDYNYDIHKEKMDAMMEFSQTADENNNDGIIMYNVIDNNNRPGKRESTDYLFRDPEQAKSADPVTYDDNGSVIPLSERFNENKKDIRYSKKQKYAPAGGIFSKALTAGEWAKYNNAMTSGVDAGLRINDHAMLVEGEKGEYNYKLVIYDDIDVDKGIVAVYGLLYNNIDRENLKIVGKLITELEDRRYDNFKVLEGILRTYSKTTGYIFGRYNTSTAKFNKYGRRVSQNQKSAGQTSNGTGVDSSTGNNRTGTSGVYGGAGGPGGVKPSRRIRTTAEIISELGEKNEVLDEALRTTKRELKKVRAEAVKAKIDMTETGGTIPKRGVITNIVAKHNDEKLTGISNREFGDRLFRLFTEFAQGEGSSDALVNAVLDVMYNKAANSEETLENENRIAIREYVAGKKFYVDDVTWRQITENSGSRGALNAAYKNTFGFTLAPSSEMKDGKGSVWSDTAAEIADQIGYVFSGSTYEDNAREGASYEVAAALYEKAASGAMSDLVHTVYDTTEDAYNAAKIETMDMVTELLRASTLRTKADRYVDQMERIKERYLQKAEKREAKIREIIEKLKAEKAELKTNMAGELKEQKQKTADLRTEKNLRYEAMRRYYIDRNREAVQQRNETKRRAAARKNITKTVKWLNDRFVNETDTKNIPERMKSIVAPFLQVFLDEETTPGGNTTIFRYEQLNRLAEFYDRFNDTVDPEEISQDLVPLLGLFDEDVAVTLRNLRDTVAGRRLSDLTLAELEDVKKVMQNLKHIVQNAGAAFVNGRRVMIADAGNEMIRHAQEHKLSLSQKAEQIPLIGKKIKGANAYLNTSMLKPIFFFKEKLGGTIGQFYDGIREGQNTWYFRIADARDFFEETKERFGYKDWRKDAHHFTTERGDRLSLDVEAIMQLYATYNRERLNTTDTNHILEGGIVLGEKLAENQRALDKKADAKRSAEEYADNSRIRLSVTDIENIISVLSEEQIGYADAVVDYLSTTCAEWGNEASMQLFGIRKYNESHYFPFQSADNFLFTRFGQQQEARLKHVGFTNRLQHGANNPLIISSLTEVAAGHASQMASYSSLAVPIENMQRLYNYKNNTTTVKSEIENAYGSSAKAYLNTFMSDINGGVRNDRIGGIFNNMVGKFKRAAVMLNMSVVVQQPSAVTRAMALVDPKYFVRSTFRFADYEELLKYSGVAGVKDIGGFDTGTGTGTIGFITGDTSVSEKLGNVTGYLAEKADRITWSHIWNAVKRETAAKMGIKYQSDMPEEFYAEAAKRFNDVVDYTQVYDSVLSRSEVMRSKDNLAKMVSAFMAEPTTTYNMLVASGKNKSIGKAAAITAFIMNVVLNTALKDLVAAWRDDSDKTYWERYVNKFFGDIFGSPEAFHLDSEFSMIGMIPWVKDILSLFAGYDVERSDITALEEIVDVIGQLREFLGKEDITDDDIKELIFAAVVAISDLTGLPLKSVARDINGLKAQLERAKNADYHTTLDTIKREIAAAWAGDPKKRESVYQAVLNGDEETIRRYMTPSAEDIQKITDANGWTEEQAKAQAEADAADKFHAAVREALKENDDRILEAAQARYDGKIGVYADIAQEIIDEGIFDRDDILAAISSEFNKLKNADADEYEDPEAKDVAMFVKSDFINAMIGGDADTAEAARNEIIRSAVANGKTEEQAAKSFEDAVTKSAKEMFFADEISQKQALGILQEAGVKKSDAEGKVNWWSWDKEYGQTYPDIDQTTYNAWVNKGLEGKGISFDTWAAYKTECQKLRGGTGNTVTKDQKMKVIDGMKLTYSQKDALYYAEGWAASRIYEAPWH